MAKLRVSPELIAQALFRGADKCPEVRGASWDGDYVVLDIVGDDVPEVDEVIAQFTRRSSLTVEFCPVES